MKYHSNPLRYSILRGWSALSYRFARTNFKDIRQKMSQNRIIRRISWNCYNYYRIINILDCSFELRKRFMKITIFTHHCEHVSEIFQIKYHMNPSSLFNFEGLKRPPLNGHKYTSKDVCQTKSFQSLWYKKYTWHVWNGKSCRY